MAKRVFEIAKDLGIKSKAVVEKCHAEGIPSDVIKNHMSTVSAGLDATIREWFAGSNEAESSPHTAVETSEKVDIEKVRETKPRKAKAKKATPSASTDDTDTGGGSATAIAEPPTTSAASPAAASASGDTPKKKTAPRITAGLSTTPPVSDPPADTSEQVPEVDEKADDQAPKTTRIQAPKPTTPAPMNVPTRPQTITPAGPRIEEIEKKKVKLGGPKIIRVEAADPIEAPRSRAPRGPRPGGGGGGGYGAPAMPGNSGSFNRGGGGGGGAGAGRNDRRRGGSGVPTRRQGSGGGDSGSGWTAADLAEREARLQRSGGYLKARRQQIKRAEQIQSQTPAKIGGKVTINEPFTIKDLSAATGVKGVDIVKKLFMQGVMATINSGVDAERAQEIMIDWDIELEVTQAKSAEQKVAEEFEDRVKIDEQPRGPIVTILGHVDHGKTSLLDRIRSANVAEAEAGGITQATSAFRVPVSMGDEEKQVVFIDTPGHEAFTEMRARGANVTDIVVLVVAADDGVMPQTAESISHAKAAGVPIIVALNKIDKPEATDSNIQRILGQLAENGLNPTEWGGETEIVKTSALKNEGIQDILEILDLQSQILELTADFDGPARGTVIEARPEGGRGNVANILIQDGKLSVGDFIVIGRAFGRVRDITDDHGKKLKTALPPMPVQISGINDLPDAGDKFFCVESLKKAEQAAQQRRDREREEQLAQPKMTLDRMFSELSDRDMKEIRVVLKADVQGSVDVLKNEIEKVAADNDEVKVRVIHSAVGGVTDSDILLANASAAVIIGFNVIANAKGRKLAETKSVEIRNYQVIYDIVEDIKKAAEGLLAPELRQDVLGHAEVRKVFKVSKVGAIAGCYITDGVVQRNAKIRITRNEVVIEDNRTLEQLKRFKDDAAEVRSGMECGMKIVGYDDIKEGDVLECYKQIEVARTL